MDPLTHALSGALLARAVAQSPPQLRPERETVLPLRVQITAGFTAAAFPDVDFALRLIDTLTYLNWHQGPTHSLILLPLWAWLLARLFAWLTQRHDAWKLFLPPICLGIAIHIAGDFITSYGLMLFAPFSTERFSLPLVFVIDPWFSLIIIAGLIISWRYPRQRIAAMAALACLCGYVIFYGLCTGKPSKSASAMPIPKLFHKRTLPHCHNRCHRSTGKSSSGTMKPIILLI